MIIVRILFPLNNLEMSNFAITIFEGSFGICIMVSNFTAWNSIHQEIMPIYF